MKSITIHNIKEPLATLIQEEAKKRDISLNKTIKALLEKALGVYSVSSRKKRDLSRFSGLWTKKEYKEFEKATEDFERIDQEDWK